MKNIDIDTIEIRNKVCLRIEQILKIDGDFCLDVRYLQAIHKFLFRDIIPSCGEFRTINLSKKEYILNGDSVIYPDFHTIKTYLEYDFKDEKKICYRHLSEDQMIKKLADFCVRIWATHPFVEGNTRTVSVFMEKYLRHMGYNVDNNMFRDPSYHFRDILVKATYENLEEGIIADKEPLITFLKCLISKDKSKKITLSDLYVKKRTKK